MSNATTTSNSISVHGRGSLTLPFKLFGADGVTQTDISAKTFYFEVDGISFRKALTVDPADAKGLLISLTRNDIALLKTTDCPFAVIDETNPTAPVVEWDGTIKRFGFVGAPDGVIG